VYVAPWERVVPSFGGTLSFLFTTNLTSFNKRRGQLRRLILGKLANSHPRSHEPAKSHFRTPLSPDTRAGKLPIPFFGMSDPLLHLPSFLACYFRIGHDSPSTPS
jgi:hypothetical protein